MSRATCHVQDPAWSRGATSTVARAMVGYISLLFSCRDCAANFQVKIFLLHRKYFSPAAPGPREHGGVSPEHAGPEPAVAVGHPQHRQPGAGRRPHRGDTHHTTPPSTYFTTSHCNSHRSTSQDPMAPKIQWPSKHNCPTCRINGYGNVWTPRKL